MNGFKSFARQTEIPFDKTLSVIVGPNGSGKSNISEAICFVLGRMSAKSMRADKSANLIYNGKSGSSDEAIVELVFDNTSRIFALDNPEVKISREVRKNGNSTYRINENTKTRQEVLELLSQAGLDPNGFNIVLQEEIAKFVEMHPVERREIIEEVAGISVYEERKHKSLLEMDRTDEKLKEVNTILNERTTYLKNLDKERTQALHCEKIKKSIERDKAAILFRQIEDKSKEDSELTKKISEKEKTIEKSKISISELDEKIKKLNSEIEELNKQVEKATGVEQEQLHNEVSNERAEVAGLSVRHENFTQRIQEIEKRKEQLELEIKRNNSEIESLKASIPKENLKKALKQKTDNFSSLEEKKEKLDNLKSEHIRLKNDIHHYKTNYDSLVSRINHIQAILSELSISKESEKNPDILKKIEKNISETKELEKSFVLSSNKIAELKKEIFIIEKLKKDIAELDMCPICRRKVTKDHIKEVHGKSDRDIEKLSKNLEKEAELSIKHEQKINNLKSELDRLRNIQNKLKISEISNRHFFERQSEKQNLEKEIESASSNIKSIEKTLSNLEIEIARYKDVEENYLQLKEDLKNIREKDDRLSIISIDIISREKEVENMHLIIKKSFKEKEEMENSLMEINEQLSEKKDTLDRKEKQEKKIYEEFNKIFKKKGILQEALRAHEQNIVESRMRLRYIEDEFNILKISKAETAAKVETYNNEFEQYKHLEIESLRLRQTKEEIEARIRKNEIEMGTIGSVNLRALEVYDKVKDEYDKISEKVNLLESEKQEILNVISEIDKKKKKSFMKMLEEINSKFSDYFLKLGGKESYLLLENQENPFEGGVDIEVKISKSKYLDVSSLSGGERALVALSLIFAIQELKPYCFYIFDEIDASLDKRNSERLAGLLKTYMKNAQYIVITHNDSLITEANSLYGVSMQEGVSKVLSLKV